VDLELDAAFVGLVIAGPAIREICSAIREI